MVVAKLVAIFIHFYYLYYFWINWGSKQRCHFHIFFKYIYSFCRYIVYLFMHFCYLYHFWIIPFLDNFGTFMKRPLLSAPAMTELTLTNDNSNFINIKNAPRIPGCILIKEHFELSWFLFLYLGKTVPINITHLDFFA